MTTTLPTITYTADTGLRWDGEPIDPAELRAWLRSVEPLLREFEAALTAAGWAQRSRVCWSRGGR